MKEFNLKQKALSEQIQKDRIRPIVPRNFNAYPFLIAVMSAIQMLCILYGRHFISVFGFNVALGNLVFTPILLYIFQIVAECYGWQYARQIVWCNFFVNGTITIFTFAFKYVPYTSFNHSDLEYSYQHLIDTIWVSALINWITIFLVDYLSTMIMCKFRSNTKGDYMILRIISVHCIAEIVVLSGGAISYLYNHFTLAEIWDLQYHMFFLRTLCAIALIPLARFIIYLIQNLVEKVVTFEYGANNWNIFHWNVQDKETIQFGTKEWNALSIQEKKNLNLNKIALDFYTDEKLGIKSPSEQNAK
jgi:uncharacterized PurR-regulated membrane protein YhhQ (DUF165 family)